jgi:hypothetical protein
MLFPGAHVSVVANPGVNSKPDAASQLTGAQ